MTVVNFFSDYIIFQVKGSNSVTGENTSESYKHYTDYYEVNDVVKTDSEEESYSDDKATVAADEDNEVIIYLHIK